MSDLPLVDSKFGKFVWTVAIKKLLGLGFRDVVFGDQPDELPPPKGWDTWDAYFLAKELSDMDFLPLGDPAEGSKLSAVWTRVGEDVCTIGLHLVHANPGVPGDTLAFTDDERAAAEARFSTLWDGIKGAYAESLVLDRYEWHNFGVGLRRPNPKARETLLTPVAGGGSIASQLPPQVATSITLKTDHRKTWGRVYLPAPINTKVINGLIDPDFVAELRTAFGTFADGVLGDGTPLVIWSPRHAGAALQFFKADSTHPESAHALNLDEPDITSFAKSVTQVQVDDLFDVIRDRRFDRATVKDTHTIG